MLKLDLRDLTDARVEEARPHLGACAYAAPCIIGTLIPAERRAEFDNLHDELGDALGERPTIEALTKEGLIAFANPRQEELAQRLQNTFDHQPDRFDEVLADVRKELAK